MPRGYLKHAQGQSRKLSRGGGSHRSSARTHVHRTHDRKRATSCASHVPQNWNTTSEYFHEMDWEDDDIMEMYNDQCDESISELKGCDAAKEYTSHEWNKHLPSTTSTSRESTEKEEEGPMRECPICFECRPVVRLMKSCYWHEAACIDCMRQVYVVQAQKSARNYPLQCFHPQCRRPIRESQLIKRGLIHSKAELTQHFRLSELAKGNKPDMCTVHCPHCDHPRAYKRDHPDKKVTNRVFSCRECRRNFMVSPFAQIVRAMENSGEGSDWAQCPECKMLISKEESGYDDEQVVCVCGACFDWRAAQRQSGFRYPFGRPSGDLDPYDVLYLYW